MLGLIVAGVIVVGGGLVYLNRKSLFAHNAKDIAAVQTAVNEDFGTTVNLAKVAGVPTKSGNTTATIPPVVVSAPAPATPVTAPNVSVVAAPVAQTATAPVVATSTVASSN